jgi:hypothetical protein
MGARIARRSCYISQSSHLRADRANTDHTRVAVPNEYARLGGGRSAQVRTKGDRVQPTPGCAIDGAQGPAPARNQRLGIALLTAASIGLGINLLADASSVHGVHNKIRVRKG